MTLAFFCLHNISFAQEFNVIKKSELQKKDISSYEVAVDFGDSLFGLYHQKPFKIGSEEALGKGYEDGLSFIIEVYEKALIYKPQDQHAISKLLAVYEEIELQRKSRLKVHFDQLMEKGDHYFSLKQFDKAEQLYQAAKQVFPNDSLCNERLKMLESRPKN